MAGTIQKLYSTTGQATDASITQKAISDLLVTLSAQIGTNADALAVLARMVVRWNAETTQTITGNGGISLIYTSGTAFAVDYDSSKAGAATLPVYLQPKQQASNGELIGIRSLSKTANLVLTGVNGSGPGFGSTNGTFAMQPDKQYVFRYYQPNADNGQGAYWKLVSTTEAGITQKEVSDLLDTRAERFAAVGAGTAYQFGDSATADQVLAILAADYTQQLSTNSDPPTLLALGQLVSLDVPAAIRYLNLELHAALTAPNYSISFSTNSSNAPAGLYKVSGGQINGQISYVGFAGAPGSSLTIKESTFSSGGSVKILLPTEASPGALVETITLRDLTAENWDANGLLQISTIANRSATTRNVVINLLNCAFNAVQSKAILRVIQASGTVTVNVQGTTSFGGALTLESIKNGQATVVVNDQRTSSAATGYQRPVITTAILATLDKGDFTTKVGVLTGAAPDGSVLGMRGGSDKADYTYEYIEYGTSLTPTWLRYARG